MRKILLSSMLLTGLLTLVFQSNNFIHAQEGTDPPAQTEGDGDNKGDEKKDDKDKKDDKADKDKPKDGDKEDDKAKKDKEEKKKKERADKLEASFKDFQVNGKVVKFEQAFFLYTAGFNVVTMDRKAYGANNYAFVAYPKKSLLAGEAHMGQMTGWIGTNNGWAVFGAKTGSGLALKVPSTVIFVPQNEDGSFGVPEVVEPQDVINGFTPYLYAGDGTGQYWVRTK